MSNKLRPLIQPGNILQEFTRQETTSLVEAWLEAFGANRQGVNSKAYMWHIFSAGRYASLSGEQALATYRQQVAVEYVVLSNDGDTAFTTDQLPQDSWLSDYYVFPPNLAWTMAFTHEDGWLGPYFAQHADYAKRNAINLEKIRKLREAGVARQKGWC